MLRALQKTITTDGAGAATDYIEVDHGYLHELSLIPDGTVPFTGTPTITITKDLTGEAILSKSSAAGAWQHTPRRAHQDSAGANSLFAAGGTAIPCLHGFANDRIKIVIASAGASKKAVFRAIIEG